MTRRDFIMISNVLRNRQPSRSNRGPFAMWELLAETFANELASTNPNFDRERFLQACGYYNEE